MGAELSKMNQASEAPNEYSLAYTLTDKKEIDEFSKDFMYFFRGLSIDKNYQHSLLKVPSELLKILEAEDCIGSTRMPERWGRVHSAFMEVIDNKEMDLPDICDMFAEREGNSSYEASFEQALYFLLMYKDKVRHKTGSILELKAEPMKPFSVL